METTYIHIETLVSAPLEKVWEYWTNPKHIQEWNQASADWHCPAASNDLSVGGKFSFTMAARDGSMSFDFTGVYTALEPLKRIEYTMGEMEEFNITDTRKVVITFDNTVAERQILVKESFEPEKMNDLEMQKSGWQAILESFKKYVQEN